MNEITINSSNSFDDVACKLKRIFATQCYVSNNTKFVRSKPQGDQAMRKAVLALAAAATVLSAGALFPTRADAMTLPTPAAMQDAIVDSSLVDEARHICRRVRVCGYYGCRWGTQCYSHRRSYRYRRYY